jgi:hydrogenase expression/formation protein HypE
MKASVYAVGKLPTSVLADLLARHKSRDARVVAGMSIGQDATVIDMGDRYLVAKTDPITFATDQIGWYAVNVNANDLACSGAQPRWFLCTILLPEAAANRAMVETIFEQITSACDAIGASLVGGHTEISIGIKRPIIVGQMLGEVAKDKLVTAAGAQAGDVILLTKTVAIEGTALIAHEKEKDLLSHGYDPAFLAEAKNLLYDPGISVLRDAMLATQAAPIHAMHDPTEGGVLTGLSELAQAAGLGMMVDADKIPVLPSCQRLCRHYNLHPLGLIASGALLLTVAPQYRNTVIETLSAQGIACTAIGYMLPAAEGCKIRVDGMPRDLPASERDEIAKIL